MSPGRWKGGEVTKDDRTAEFIVADLIHAENWHELEETAFQWGLQLLADELGEERLLWAQAQITYQYGDTSYLEEYVSLYPLPGDDASRLFMQGIVAGTVKPNLKAAAKIRGGAENRAEQMLYCAVTLKGLDHIRGHAALVADVLATEPSEVRAVCKRIGDDVRAMTMRCCGFKDDALKSALKKMSKILKKPALG